MSDIEKALDDALRAQEKRSDAFKQQIQRYQEFKRQMDRAGVVPNKQEFSIPLFERIGSTHIHNDESA